MGNIFQFVGTFASIFSIPLAIILYFKISDVRQNKIRLEIIRSLSYRIGDGDVLSKIEVSAVFHSKLREHNIRKPIFNEVSILEDIVADAVSNPFVTNMQKACVINIASDLLLSYGAVKKSTKKESSTNDTELQVLSNASKRKRNIEEGAFAGISGLFSAISAVFTTSFNETLSKFIQDVSIPSELVLSFFITVVAGLGTAILSIVIQRIGEKKKKANGRSVHQSITREKENDG